jgi:hypothetical protein
VADLQVRRFCLYFSEAPIKGMAWIEKSKKGPSHSLLGAEIFFGRGKYSGESNKIIQAVITRW